MSTSQQIDTRADVSLAYLSLRGGEVHNWHCNINGVVGGPFTSAELKAKAAFGEIEPSTLVRREGDNRWAEARKVSGLQFADAGAAPSSPAPPRLTPVPTEQDVAIEALPIPSVVTTKRCQFCAEEIQATAIKCKHCGEFLEAGGRQISESELQPRILSGIAAPRERLNLSEIAFRHRVLMRTLLAGLFIELILGFMIASDWTAIALVLSLVFVIFRMTVALRLGLAVFRPKAIGVLLAILTVLPCYVWLVFIVIIHNRATSVLTENGIKVGFMGADPASIL